MSHRAMNRRITAPLCAAALIFTSLGPASAQSVFVKYRGNVDLAPFKCEDINRSSFIHRICYDAAEQYMIILLQDTYYHYCEIDQVTVTALMEATSMGQYYNAHIRGIPFDCRTHKVPLY